MNRLLLSFLPLTVAVCAGAQAPAAPAPGVSITETSRVARLVPGPGDRPQAFVLRNGTFVTLSPGLAQRLPNSLHKNDSVQVAGNAFTYDGSKSIDARTITIAGVSYNDDAPEFPGQPGPAGQPAPAGAPGAVPPPPPSPGGRGIPPPPPPCGVAAPPAGRGGMAPPPPPPPDGAAPPPTAGNGAPPAPVNPPTGPQ